MAKLSDCVAVVSILCSLLTGCAAQESLGTNTDSLSQFAWDNRPGLSTVAPESLPPLRQGQVIYVPIYSELYDFNQEQTFQMTATLSLRNTDLNHPIVIEMIDYYDSGGVKIRTYLEQPLQLAPLASFEVVVPKDDQSGGVGANFIVSWRSAAAVSVPVVEAIMISTISQQGISLISPGRVIQDRTGE